MSILIRKTLLHVETTLIEGGRAAPKPLKLFAAMAVVKNPWAGRGFVENLKPEIHDVAPQLGKLLTDMILQAVGSGEAVEGYGKAAVVGLDGEIEHASALIHTLRFGNHYREAVGAKTYLAFCNTRGPANAPVMIPLMDKRDEGRRSHYLTVQTSIADAPAADEILVALGASIGGRPHHRIGDRYQDLEDLGRDHSNPAGV
ncbi:amino acid synthesis family protein [soil metagenome]